MNLETDNRQTFRTIITICARVRNNISILGVNGPIPSDQTATLSPRAGIATSTKPRSFSVAINASA
jgi:hypothetical protein